MVQKLILKEAEIFSWLHPHPAKIFAKILMVQHLYFLFQPCLQLRKVSVLLVNSIF